MITLDGRDPSDARGSPGIETTTRPEASERRSSNGNSPGHAKFDLSRAIAMHVRWIGGVWRRLNDGEPLDPNEIGRDDMCEIGQWLKNDGRRYADLPEFEAFEDAHTRFHHCAREVAVESRAGDTEKALGMLDDQEFCQSASNHLLDKACDLFHRIHNQDEARP